MVLGGWFILSTDIPHLMKYIAAALELSLRKDEKQDLEYKKCYLN